MNYKELIEEELERANKKHNPKFFSRHQAFAVLFEEYQETKEALDFVERRLKSLWYEHIRRRTDDRYLLEDLDELDTGVLNLVEEAIQIGAMVEKFKKMLEEE